MSFVPRKIHVKLSLFIGLALASLTALILLLVTTSTRSLINERVYSQEMPARLEQVRNAIEKELIVPVTTSKALSENTFLHTWIQSGESEPVRAQIIRELQQVKQSHAADVAFFVSHKTANYYTEQGLVRQVGPDEQWFYQFINSSDNYELSYDIDKSSSIPTIFVNHVVKMDGERVGLAGVGTRLENAAKILESVTVRDTLEVFLVNEQGNIVVHPFLESGGSLTQYFDGDTAFDGAGGASEQIIIETRHDGIEMIVGIIPARIGNWKIVVQVHKDHLYHSLQATISFILLVAIGLVAIFVIFTHFFAKRFVVPLHQVNQALQDIAERGGDLTREISIPSNDELGTMVRSFNRFVSSLRSIIGDVAQTAESLKKSVDSVKYAVDVSRQQVSIQQEKTDMVATAMHQMGTTVNEIAHNANLAAERANHAKGEAKSGGISVLESTETIRNLSKDITRAEGVVNSLAEDVKGISSVLAEINGVSEQTNLLALNAAIEAARAGEQGRGFAVVADEVRTLAQRTQQSTVEIGEMIERLERSSSEAVATMHAGSITAQSGADQVSKLTEVLENILTEVDSLSDMNIQIASATEEQSVVTEDVNKNVHAISESAGNTVEQVQKTTQESDLMAEQTERLYHLVHKFKY